MVGCRINSHTSQLLMPSRVFYHSLQHPRYIQCRFSRSFSLNGTYPIIKHTKSKAASSLDSLQVAASKSGDVVDQDLWTALDMCNDEELDNIYQELHGPSPFSPVVKSVVADGEPAEVWGTGRTNIMSRIESRFRFLAASSLETLRGERPTYRESLSHIRSKFNIQCSPSLDTEDLEAEIFLHILKNYRSYVMKGMNSTEPNVAAAFLEGDGMSLPKKQPSSSWRKRLVAPLKFGKEEIMSSITALGGAVTFSAMSKSIMQQMGAKVVMRQLTYQEALRVLCSQGTRNLVRKRAFQSAQKGLLLSTARFGAVRSALSLIGPMMWTWLGVDVVLKSIGTDYSRIVKTVFALAQVRLIRTHGFVQPKPARNDL